MTIAGPHPERPAGVDPDATWEVPVGVIRIRVRDEIAHMVNEARNEHPGLLAPPGFPLEPRPEWREEPLPCPVCGNTAELVVRGRRGEPATIVCPGGHTWAPAPHALESAPPAPGCMEPPRRASPFRDIAETIGRQHDSSRNSTPATGSTSSSSPTRPAWSRPDGEVGG
jgi:hypothetical protein